MPDVELIPEVIDPEHRLGFHRHHADANRDYPVARILPPGVTPTLKSWARARTPLNQGSIGSCTGNAAEMMSYELPGHISAVTKIESQAVGLYILATALDNVPGHYPPEDTGSTTVGVLAAAKAKTYIVSYRWAFDFPTALATLSIVGPVITGINWYTGMDHPDVNGFIHHTGSIRGGHELCLNKIVPDATRSGGGYVEGWNSWGKDWGPLGGRFRMDWSTWQALLNEGGEVGVGLRS